MLSSKWVWDTIPNLKLRLYDSASDNRGMFYIVNIGLIYLYYDLLIVSLLIYVYMAFTDLFIIIVSVEHSLLFAVLSTADYRVSWITLKKLHGVSSFSGSLPSRKTHGAQGHHPRARRRLRSPVPEWLGP